MKDAGGRLGAGLILSVTLLVAGYVWAEPPAPVKAAKRDTFVIAVDPALGAGSASALQAALERQWQSTAANLHLIVLDTTTPTAMAERVEALPAGQRAQLAGLIELHAGPAEPAVLAAEIYHYPFDPIAPRHIRSPEYVLKFGSDSALLGIHMHRAREQAAADVQAAIPAVEFRPATAANANLPRALLRRTLRLTWPGQGALTPVQADALGALLARALAEFHADEQCHVVGLVPEKAKRHARLQDLEIRVTRSVYPAQQATPASAPASRPAEQLVGTVKPFASGLYYVTGLERLTPYSIAFVDTSRPEGHWWREVERASFATASLGGIVRTVPGTDVRCTPLGDEHATFSPVASLPEKVDYVITRATVFDGTRDRPRFVADVAIAGEQIVAIGDLADLACGATIDGQGLFLMPGFIDIHSHVDQDILAVPDAPTHVRQGITTVLGGNCSFSALGIGAFLAAVEQQGTALNIGVLIGNRPVRGCVLGEAKGTPEYDAVYQQKELVDLAMEEGAFGLSSGLIYRISEEAASWELAELAKQVGPYGGFFASHIRGETDEVLDAAREAIHIGELAGVPVQISHMKVINRRNWGTMPAYLDLIAAARARGQDVTGDQYPWRASGPAAHRKLYDLLVREVIRAETPEVVLLKDMPGRYAAYSGRPLTELLEGEEMTAEDLVADLKLTGESPLYATYLCLGDTDVCRPMTADFVMVCTDSGLVSAERIASGECHDEHPRKFRSYPEFFARYVRDRGVCSWELGVYKCTGLPAARLKLEDRGRIRPGAVADLVLLDPQQLDPGSDFRDQAPPPRGIRWVFVNGQPALRDGELTGVRAGCVLRAYEHDRP